MEKENIESLREDIAILVEKYANQTLAPKEFIPGESVIPPSGKLLDASEIKLMVEASLDGWLTTGRFNDLFEKKLASFIGVKLCWFKLWIIS